MWTQGGGTPPLCVPGVWVSRLPCPSGGSSTHREPLRDPPVGGGGRLRWVLCGGLLLPVPPPHRPVCAGTFQRARMTCASCCPPSTVLSAARVGTEGVPGGVSYDAHRPGGQAGRAACSVPVLGAPRGFSRRGGHCAVKARQRLVIPLYCPSRDSVQTSVGRLWEEGQQNSF